ncbi:hypothetical protein HanRHA438_Chr15g0702591 [Helianthus annuus]|nr:hypothetical protein HanIR_Chr15g0750041 [Helianthus annuus]KAJ0844447.1 hypothetical protein HanRHA438_Chr15g0702591 [Helianthus annuus]
MRHFVIDLQVSESVGQTNPPTGSLFPQRRKAKFISTLSFIITLLLNPSYVAIY